MTMYFYLGKENREIREKFERIKRHYAKYLNERYSDADCFRYVVRLLYKAIITAENKKKR